MKKILITITLGMFLLSLTSAMFAGECSSIEFPNADPVNWSVEGNSSNLDGFSFTKEGTNITYCFHPLYKPDNFTITFYNYQSLEIHSGSSSKSYSKVLDNCKTDWVCSNWTICDGEYKYRTCEKMHLVCEARTEMPIIKEFCGTKENKKDGEILNLQDNKSIDNDKELNPNYGLKILFGIILLIIIGCIFYFLIFKNKESEEGIIINDDPQLNFELE